MTDDEHTTILLLKGAISEMTTEGQLKVKDYHSKFQSLISEGGEEAVIAYALLGAEMQAQS